MTSVVDAIAGSGRHVGTRLRAFAAQAWSRPIGRRYFVTLLLSLAIGIPRGIKRWTQSAAIADGLKIVAADCLEALLVGVSLLLALGAADRLSSRGGARWWPYLAAGMSAPAVGVAIARGVWSAYLLCNCGPRPYALDVAIGYVGWLPLTVLASFAYAYSRRVRKRGETLRAMQIERERLERAAVESRLQAMQARVEPQFLFNTLREVERLYSMDPARADRMLDDLITYLRAALPHLRETTSTLAKEIELARAYLDIVRLRLDGGLSFAFEVPENARNARIPPMLLLPLIEHALAHGAGTAEGRAPIAVAASFAGDRVRLAVSGGSGAFDGMERVAVIRALRERLAALYGSDGAMIIADEAGRRTRCVIEVPHECAESTDR